MLSDILDFGTMQCSLLTATFFLTLLPKREYFPLRLCVGVFLCLLSTPFINFYQHLSFHMHPATLADASCFYLVATSMKSAGNLLLYLLVLTLFFYLCGQTRLLNACYFATCAYLIQDFAYTLFVFFLPGAAHRSAQSIQIDALWIELLIFLVCNVFFYISFAKSVVTQNALPQDYCRALLYMLSILISGRILGTFSQMLLTADITWMFRFLLLYDLLLSGSLLIAQILIFKESESRQELLLESQLRQQQYQQFQTFQQSTDNLRHKCHDLKHIIQALQTDDTSEEGQQLLQELSLSIHNYDSLSNTGNRTLDALLGNIWSRCEQYQIHWTCFANGHALDFVNALDLYILFGNILDNALENVAQIKDLKKRILCVNIRQIHQMSLITVKNYYASAPVLKNGIPLTTKTDRSEHGYGMKSIQSVVSKYNGTLSIKTDHDIFSIDIMLPVPRK